MTAWEATAIAAAIILFWVCFVVLCVVVGLAFGMSGEDIAIGFAAMFGFCLVLILVDGVMPN